MGKIIRLEGEAAVKIAAEEKKIVMGLYFIMLLASLLTVVDNVPMTGVLYKVRYLYVIVIAFFFLYDGVLIWNRRFMFAFGLLALHTVLYCLVFTNPVIAEHTRVHFEQLLTCYLMVFFTALYVYKRKCYTLFLEMSTLALGMMILWSAFTHVWDFINPVYFVNIFSRTERFRSDFGMGDVNYCGNYCVYMIVLAVILWDEWKRQKKAVDIRIRAVLLFTGFVAGYMLLSTASRSAVLSIALFFVVAVVLKYRAFLARHWKLFTCTIGILAVVVLAVMVSSGVFSEIWAESNREGNISVNYPYFKAYGNYAHGMGYMDNSGFLNQVYGYETTAMDIYYLYIFFSTGIVGSVLLFGQMLYVLFCLLRHSKTEGRDMALSLFAMMAFYAIWQVNYMNYRYWTGMLHMILLFVFLLRIREEKDTCLIQLKRR